MAGVTESVTREKEQEFLDLLRFNGNVTVSARQVGCSRKVFYDHRNKYPAFREAWDEALEEATEHLEEEVRRRGQDGYDEPVFWKGVQTATVRKYSDNLLMFLMKKRNPEFRDTVGLDLPRDTKITVVTAVPGDPGSDA